MSDDLAPETPSETPAEAPLRSNGRGGFLRTGNPGNRGGGRTPDAFKRMCKELATRRKTLGAIKKILKDPDHPHFMAALKWSSENGYGKPTQVVAHAGADGTGPMQMKITHEIVDPAAPNANA